MTLQSATRDRQDAREQVLALTFGNLASGASASSQAPLLDLSKHGYGEPALMWVVWNWNLVPKQSWPTVQWDSLAIARS